MQNHLTTSQPAQNTPRGMLTIEMLAAKANSGEIDTVVVAVTDHMGRLIGKRFDVDFFLSDVASHGTHGCDYLLTVDMEMTPIPGYKFANWELGYGDFHMVVDLSTLRIASWLDRTALVLCDVEVEHGDRVLQGEQRVLGVVQRTEQAAFLAGEGDEHNPATLAVLVGAKATGEFEQAGGAGTVVVGAVVDLGVAGVAGADFAATQVIVVGADHDGLVRLRAVALQHADHVLDVEFLDRDARLGLGRPTGDLKALRLAVLQDRFFDVLEFFARGLQEFVHHLPANLVRRQGRGRTGVPGVLEAHQAVFLAGHFQVVDEQHTGRLALGRLGRLGDERGVLAHFFLAEQGLVADLDLGGLPHDHDDLPGHIQTGVVVVLLPGGDAIAGEHEFAVGRPVAGDATDAELLVQRQRLEGVFGTAEDHFLRSLGQEVLPDDERLKEAAISRAGLQPGRLERGDNMIGGLVQSVGLQAPPLALFPGQEENVGLHFRQRIIRAQKRHDQQQHGERQTELLHGSLGGILEEVEIS